MRYRSALRELAEVTESQWGMVTSAQAIARGLSHVDLARLADSGDLVRIAHGVYKDAGAPSDEHQELRAAWLSIEPGRLAEQRIRDRPGFATVSGESAAALHGVGELRTMRSEFTTLKRKQTQRSDIRYRVRPLTEEEVTLRAGLPVTTLERTIADLLESRVDPSLIGGVVRDAALRFRIDYSRLIEQLNPLASRYGFRKGDGEGLLEHLQAVAGITAESIALRLGQSLMLITPEEFERLPDENRERVQELAHEMIETLQNKAQT